MSKKVKKSDRIRQALKKGVARAEIVKTLNVSPQLVYAVARKDGYIRKRKSKLFRAVLETERALKAALSAKSTYKLADGSVVKRPEMLPKTDLVNNPAHYTAGGFETLDFIEAKDLNYRLGNVVKYVSRAGKKANSDPVIDLEKAAFYLRREIEIRKRA